MKSVQLHEAKARLSELIEAVQQGEDILMLVAQALLEGMILVNKDAVLDIFAVRRVW